MPHYVNYNTITQLVDISIATLVEWVNKGQLSAIQLPGNGKRLYDYTQLCSLLGITEQPDKEEKRSCVCYARVSSDKQKEDLARQIQHLQQACYTTISTTLVESSE